jgi:hypothetical protein
MESSAVRFGRVASFLFIPLAFAAGFFVRSFPPQPETDQRAWHPVTFVSVPEDEWRKGLPRIEAWDTAGLKSHAGKMTRVHGLVERVGYSERSHTYFLNLGSRRSHFTGVIFSPHAPAFEKKGIQPKSYEGKVVEITGRLRDDPIYGLEIFIEDPSQIHSE